MKTSASPAAGQSRSIAQRLLASRAVARILRNLYRWTHSRALRHNQVLWPLLRIERDGQGRLARCAMRWGVTPLQTAFSSIRRPAGDVAHLILSGPSVADIGYSELDLPAVMGVNGSIALRRSHPHLRFAYYAMLDAGFVSRRRDLVADVLAQDLLLFVTPEVLRGIAQLFSPDDIRCRIAVFEEVHQRAYLPRAQPEQLARTLRDDPDLVLFDAHAPIHPLGFSLDPARGLFGGGTVAYSALQLLVWLGFRTLYLHGLDLRGASVSPRFYESADARLPSALDRQFDSHIRPAFRDASRLLGARGLRIYNLSPGSALDESVFPKRHWTTLKRHALPS